MAIIFGEDPPVFSKPPNSAATVAQTPYSGGQASGQQPPHPTAGCSFVGEPPSYTATVGQIVYSREQVSVQLASYPTAGCSFIFFTPDGLGFNGLLSMIASDIPKTNVSRKFKIMALLPNMFP